eukprot:15432758-Alexandrium_andersonii.AAC.1
MGSRPAAPLAAGEPFKSRAWQHLDSSVMRAPPDSRIGRLGKRGLHSQPHVLAGRRRPHCQTARQSAPVCWVGHQLGLL